MPPRRRMGRPPLDGTSPAHRVTVYMPVPMLDALCREAVQKQVSVPEVIRRKLRQADQPEPVRRPRSSQP